jgi:hypothetical protein
VKRLVAGLVAVFVVLLIVTGCGRYVDGSARAGARSADPSFFFAGEVSVYGQTVSNTATIALAYLRALRRIDVCGLVDRQVLAKVGEISSLGTLYAFDECDVEVKLPGEAARRFVSIELSLARTDQPVAFRAGGTPIYQTAGGSCEYLMPLDLSHLPGATKLRKPDQPYVRVGMIGAQDCELTKKIVAAIAERVSASALPARDGAAVYPSPLAERDPCEVLSVIAGDVDHWDVSRTRPYQCEFGMWRDGYPDVVSMRLSLEPKIVDIATADRQHRTSGGGADIYLDPTFCSAITFVGPPMQRRLAGGDFVDVANLVVRPAVIVDSGEAGCADTDLLVDVAGTAAKLYG